MRFLLGHPLTSAMYAVARRLVAGSHNAEDSGDAAYCLREWREHVARLRTAGSDPPRAIAELGPGASLGLGICALLDGVDRYTALDVVPYASQESNLAVLDGIAEALGDEGRPPPAERVEALRLRIAGRDLEYIAPWDDPSVLQPAAFDWVVSTSVLEHVDDVAGVWSAMAAWVKVGGFAGHQIDFRCHDKAIAWNGHWAYPDWMWRWLRGKGSAVNRVPLSSHLQAAEAAGFSIVSVDVIRRYDGLARRQLQPRWRSLSDDDLSASSAYIVARRI